MTQGTHDMTINIDGAARGNPGPAAYGIVIARAGADTFEEGACLGSATNNVAEYTALVRALEHAHRLGGKRPLIHSDSELMVKQMNGVYKVKNEQLKKLYEQAQDRLEDFEAVTIRHVRREQNSWADRLCNEALDGNPRSSFTEAVSSSAKEAPPDGLDGAAVACLQEANVPDAEAVWGQLRAILKSHRVRLPR